MITKFFKYSWGNWLNQSILWKFILRYWHTMEFPNCKPFIKWPHSLREETGFTLVGLLPVNKGVVGQQAFNGNSSMV